MHKYSTLLSTLPPTPLGQILDISILEYSPTLRRRLRILGHYALTIVTEGNGTYRDVGGRLLEIGSGTAFLTFPEIPLLAAPPLGKTWREINICFKGAQFELMRREKLIDPDSPLRHSDLASKWHDAIMNVASAPHETEEDRLKDVLSLAALLLEIRSEGKAPDSQGTADWLERACHILSRDFTRPIDIGFVAKHVAMSSEAFRKQFSAKMGLPPMQYRARLRLDLAKQLLANTVLPAKQIAAAVGYSSEAPFSRLFRKVTGVTPLTYRAQSTSPLPLSQRA